ncbi:hypothetical protein BJY00DRAFT_311308 [Aspergillus carlsbadensis]|nr:hypothetical protein BJY00DRAFT_311308 [Aspergillus carlsbadensis]
MQSGYQGLPPDWFELWRQKERGIVMRRMTLPLMDHFRDVSHDLLNELVLALPEHPAALFPGIENPNDYKSPHNIAYERFSGFTNILYGIDEAVALEKMIEFLNARLPKARQVDIAEKRARAMLRVMVYLRLEIFYVAHDRAVGQGDIGLCRLTSGRGCTMFPRFGGI